MKGLKKQRRIQVLALAGVCIAGVLAVLWFLPKDAFQFFRTPTEVLASPPSEDEYFQIGGMVLNGSMTPTEGVSFRFVVTDGNTEVPVVYVGNDPAPDLFGEGQGTIAKGYYVNGVFEAREILAKHDESYMPAEVSDSMPAEVIDALRNQGKATEPNG